MKLTKLILGLATLAVGIASAASSHSITFAHSVWIGATQLKAGDYKVEVQGDKAVFTSGKQVVAEAPATVGTSDKKFGITSFVAADSKVSEIDLGGTTTKILFATPVSATK